MKRTVPERSDDEDYESEHDEYRCDWCGAVDTSYDDDLPPWGWIATKKLPERHSKIEALHAPMKHYCSERCRAHK